ncbi:MAG: hypothetical protein K8R37_14150, partial [Bacteroidales bacterium]|nr:hypothetical protein [Bacteroidales bacterium]
MKIVKVLLIAIGITIILVVISIKSFPEWLVIPGGILMLSGIAFNWVLDAGGKIKSWMELFEKREGLSKEDEIQRNLNLKRRIECDFQDWLNFLPENRKRNSKMLLRAFDGNQYPDSNKPDRYGEYSWFAAEIKSIYHSGLEFIYGIVELVVFDDNTWDFREGTKGENLSLIKTYRVGQINFSDIIDYDLEGDEHYPFPHFFCKFRYKGLPFEETYFKCVDKIPPYYFEYKTKRSKARNAT